ncbi:hypothetical protein C8F04DRAFT_1077144 [Mycena alexandri]|uniref:Uncharacterized protein n=1 Tax=Mycena alexandri TaxID=1745969 RepID=A0AAD6T9Z2_9AGAR|nr:hypothetical protein C8F04DRAFT_1077144 [Mycena alexandri]
MENMIFASEGGAFFAGSQGFTINSSIFNNLTEVTTAGVPPGASIVYISFRVIQSWLDIRTIPMGDIDLQRQLRPDELRFDNSTGVVGHKRRRSCVRRVYSGKVEGRNSDMTVAMYDGDTAEQEWQQDIAKHMRMRHPNILQVYGIASVNGMHATLFHGDLIPYKYFRNLYKHSPVLTVYILISTAAQYWVQNSTRMFSPFMVSTGSNTILWISFWPAARLFTVHALDPSLDWFTLRRFHSDRGRRRRPYICYSKGHPTPSLYF